MEVKSVSKYVRISAFKVRDVARCICGLEASQALDLLQFTPKKAAIILRKTLKTAIADATNNFNLDAGDLYVHMARADEGPTLDRHMPRARGSGAPIRKRSAHITVIVTDEAPPQKERTATRGARERKNKGAVPKKSNATAATEEVISSANDHSADSL